jgi:hypothetical protein
MRHINDIFGRLERLACVAIAASSPSVPALPWKSGETPCDSLVPPTPREWAEYVVKHAEALRKTLRWAWAARMEDDA